MAGYAPHNVDGFWTYEILRKLNYFNFQRGNQAFQQGVFEQARAETKTLYQKRQECLNQVKEAKKKGNAQLVQFYQERANKYREDYEKQQHLAQLQIFQIKNAKLELKDTYIDLHGLQKEEAINIVRRRLGQIQIELTQGAIQPSVDAHNHIVKLVCGKGIHSQGRAVLKFAIPQWLDERQYDYYNFQNDGVVLVRLIKGQ
ncbi:hypothetical protein FGO68_gene16803 [Halteria grandinella]|uniref:Smr domain-containing protein n=1 Tax=Halteria grandinella TaxID=5974 RepID=A0A8J8T796_HALGN|nr:hypothetical protein FGO68_gene16803 [Halteria grandinella]